MPDWASPGAINARGIVATTQDQFDALVEVEKAVLEAICDTGGAKTVASKDLAQDLGW